MVTTICPSRETLFQYSIGMLNGPERDALNDHLESCSDCQATIMTLDDTDDTVVGRLRMPSNDSFMDEPQLQAALKAAMELPLHTKGPFSPSEPSAEMRKTLGEYQILEELGRGGMGRVYKARHTKLNRVVAVKLLARPKLGDPQAINRFEREMQAVGLLDHQNIVQAHDAREIDDMPVLIMEFIDGLDLAELVRRIGPLPIADACELIRRTALALQYAHEHGLVHRDIKPSNIMLSKAGEVKLLDLGLARFYVEAVAGEEMTGSGQAMGTADYIAPEQASDSRSVDIRADIYSLGCTLYKLLSGRAPFSGPEYRGTLDKMNAHVHGEIPPLGQFVADLPSELAAIIDRMLAKNPDDRFATPSEVAASLEPFCKEAALPELITRAISLPVNSWAKAEKSHDANFFTPRTATAPNRRRPIVKSLLIGMGFLGAMAIGLVAGILITIKRNGETQQLNVPNNSQTTIDENGNATVKIGGKPAAANPPAVNPAAELKALQGDWETVQQENGDAADLKWTDAGGPFDAAKISRIVFRNEYAKLANFASGDAFSFYYRIDPTATPKSFDILDQTEKESLVAVGTYGCNGDKLEICLAKYQPALKNNQRPTGFSLAPNTGDMHLTLKRHQPSADEKKLHGDWQAAKEIHNGEEVPAANLRNMIWEFADGLAYLKNGPQGMQGVAWYGPFVLDENREPKTITIHANQTGMDLPSKIKIAGIYRFDGDRLNIAYREGDKPPEKFESTPGSGVTLLEMEKPKPESGAAPFSENSKANDDQSGSSADKPGVPAVNPAAELKALQGSWNVVRIEKGKDAQFQGAGIMLFGKGRVCDILGSEHNSYDYRIDPTKEPKTIDLFRFGADGRQGDPVGLGIYQIEGENLKICLAEHLAALNANQRASSFQIEPNSANILIVLHRVHPSADEKLLQGDWEVASQLESGKAMGDDPWRNTKFRFADHEVVNWTAIGTPFGGKYVLDATKQPPQITMFTSQWKPGEKNPHPISVSLIGIYKIDGDHLTIAYRSNGQTLDKFESAPGSGVTLLELKRSEPENKAAEKPAEKTKVSKEVDAAAEWQALQGSWKVRNIGKGKDSDQAWGRIAGDGNPLDPATTDRFDFDKSRDPPLYLVRPSRNSLAKGLEVNFHTSGSSQGFYYSIDPTAMPKRINLLIKDLSPTGIDLGKKLIAAGIYKIEEDQLTICLRAALPDIDSPQWPNDFVVDPDSGNVLYVFQRHRPTDDEKMIQNSWTLINRLVDGKTDIPEKGPADSGQFHFGKDNYFFFGISDLMYGDYFLDSEKQPKAITLYDYKNQKPDKNGIHAIYKFDGDKLLITSRPDGKAPEKFESTPGSGVTLLELKRSEPKPATEGIPAPDDSKKKSEQSGKAAEKTQKPTLPDLRLSGTEVTAEAISRLADRHWGTVTLAQAKLDGAVIEPLRRAASISSLRLFGTDLSGQILRLQNVHGLTALEIGAPLRGLDFEALAKLTQLERLSLPQDLTINVIGAHEIAELVNLKSLRLYGVNIDDACFVELRPLIHLEELDLSNTQITDEGLSILEKMPHLRTLELERHNIVKPQLTDACLLPISRLLELERLSLSGKITDAGLVQVGKLPKLKSLSILSTKITGEGLKALEHSTVEDLTLSSDQISPAMSEPALVNFAKCRSLKRVFVNGQISEADMLKYQRSLPNISWSFNM